MTYKEMIKEFETMDKNDLAKACRNLFIEIEQIVSSSTGNKEIGFNFVSTIVANVIAADEKLGTSEYALFAFIIGNSDLNRQQVINFIQDYYCDDLVTNIGNIMESSGENVQKNVVTLALGVAAIDGNVSPEENRLIQYLMNR